MLYNKFLHVNLWFNHSFLCLALGSWLLVRVVLVFRHVRKIVTVSFIMFVCTSVLYPFSRNSLPSTGWLFLKFGILVFFWKSVDTIRVSLQTGKNYGYFTGRPLYILDHISLSSSYNEKCFRWNFRENQNANLCSITFFSKIVPLMR